MNIKFISAMSAIFAIIGPDASYAQSKCDAIKPSATEGLTLTVKKILVKGEVTVQFLISNGRDGRVYLKSAQWSDAGKAFLGSGGSLYTPVAASIETTNGGTGAGCVTNPQCTSDLNRFSYIEAHDSLPFSYKYASNVPIQQNDTISFSVVLVARFSKSTDTSDRSGEPKVIRFNFNSIPLEC